jgi:hypothetical protein
MLLEFLLNVWRSKLVGCVFESHAEIATANGAAPAYEEATVVVGRH